MELENVILKHVNRPDYRPVKTRVLAEQLKLPDDAGGQLKSAIIKLIKKGRLRYTSNRLVQRVDAGGGSHVTGIFRRARGGFGFVRPATATRAADKTEDIHIPAERTRDAASGDLVQVRLRVRRGSAGRGPTGEIVEIIQRETNQFVGTYIEAAGAGFVQVDGTIFAQPVMVTDAGAKNVQPGDKAVVEMVRFPSHVHDGEGVIVEVLGPRGAPGVDTLSILREYNLPDEFPEDVLERARGEAEKFDESIGKHRSDLTGLTTVTIDPKDARDFDDAISLERIENGHWRLGVHIADVSHFVRPKTPLDREARDRGTSVYLADQVLPMLPEIISNNLASLQPNRVRYTKTVFIEFTADGVPVATQAESAAIKSRRRFTYEEVDSYLEDSTLWKKKLTAAVFQLLGQMHELAMILRRRRLARGAIELSLRELKLDLNKDGKVCGAHFAESTESHQIIEEFMLAANEAVARLFSERQLSFLRRIHEPPDPRKLKALTEFVTDLGIPTESLESRFELKRIIEHVAGRPEEHAVNYAVLRSFQKAIYSPAEEGHFALGSDHYCHFTSPIRRYPDLTIHRLLDAVSRNRKPESHHDSLLALGEHCSDREQRAEAAERELIKVKLLDYMSERVGERMEAVVTGVEQFGLFAQGTELPAEGLIHISSLQDDYYHFDRTTHSLAGRRKGNSYRLGDLIEVEITHVDVDRRQLDFRLIASLKNKRHAEKPAAKKSSPPRKKSTTARQPKTKSKGQKKSGRKPASGKRKVRRK